MQILHNKLEVPHQDGILVIDSILEPFLYLLVEYGYMSKWILENTYQDATDLIIKQLTNFITIENTFMGKFLRPKKELCELFGIEFKQKPIIINLAMISLNEQYIAIEIMLGKIKFDAPPRYSFLGLPLSDGTNVILGRKLKSSQAWSKLPEKEVENFHKQTLEAVKKGENPEFKNKDAWCIIEKTDRWKFWIPRLIIPIKNNNIAIEIDITTKTLKDYMDIYNMYKNNYIYKKLVFFSNNNILYQFDGVYIYENIM